MAPAPAAAPLAIGCMRLSTAPDRDDDRGVTVIHAALDAGVTLLDTADAYCWNDSDSGHNERLIARALASWSGDTSRVVVATKGGLTRPNGDWIPDGRARHLRAACEASCSALGVDRIALYQLHAPDSRTPLSTSVRALAGLQRDGLVESIGLCNVNVGQIEEARRIAEIAAVQMELSVWRDEHILSGVVRYCLDHGIRLLAHRPLGGPARRARTAADPVLSEIAARHGVTSFDVALAWLRDFSNLIVPLPGPSRPDTASRVAQSLVALTDDDRRQLDAHFPAGRQLRAPDRTRAPAPSVRGDGDIAIVMGLPGAGKSTVAASLVADGYLRLNRDDTGGTLADLLPALDRALTSGTTRIVLDNTYPSRASRAGVIDVGRRHGVPVRCLWLATTLEDAQVNAVMRIVTRHGSKLGEEDLRVLRKKDPGALGPSAQFRYQRELEPPTVEEGFASVEILPFERRRDPSRRERAIVVWCDDVVCRSRSGRRAAVSPDDVEIIAPRAELLRRRHAEGWRILGLAWRPEIADGSATADDVDRTFDRVRELLGVDIDIACCPHAAGPPKCWCRKPLPGLGVVFIERYQLDPARCVYVGDGPQDPGFARRLGFEFQTTDDFFGS